MIIRTGLKCFFLTIAIAYSISIIGNLKYKQSISGWKMFFVAIGIVMFLAIHLDWF